MTKKPKEQPSIDVPEDLGIKIGTKEEVFWTSIQEKAEEFIKNAKHEIQINQFILDGAIKKISEEKEKFK